MIRYENISLVFHRKNTDIHTQKIENALFEIAESSLLCQLNNVASYVKCR